MPLRVQGAGKALAGRRWLGLGRLLNFLPLSVRIVRRSFYQRLLLQSRNSLGWPTALDWEHETLALKEIVVSLVDGHRNRPRQGHPEQRERHRGMGTRQALSPHRQRGSRGAELGHVEWGLPARRSPGGDVGLCRCSPDHPTSPDTAVQTSFARAWL